MNFPVRGKGWWGVAGLTAVSLALYYLNVLFFLFLVPLAVLYIRRGRPVFLLSAAVVLVTVGAISWATGGSDANTRLMLAGTELLFAFLFVVGIYLVLAGLPGIGRRLYRLLIGVGIAAFVSFPLLVFVTGTSVFHAALVGGIDMVGKILSGAFDPQGGGPAAVFGGTDIESIVAAVRETLLSYYLFAYFVIVAGTWRIGTLLAARAATERPAPLVRFALPEGLLWPVVLAWAAVLLGRFAKLGPAGNLVWNAGMIGAFLYGLQGIGIVQHLFVRWGFPRPARILVAFAAVVLLLVPGAGTIVLIGVPVLGISELWVNFGRFGRRVRGNESHTE